MLYINFFVHIWPCACTHLCFRHVPFASSPGLDPLQCRPTLQVCQANFFTFKANFSDIRQTLTVCQANFYFQQAMCLIDFWIHNYFFPIYKDYTFFLFHFSCLRNSNSVDCWLGEREWDNWYLDKVYSCPHLKVPQTISYISAFQSIIQLSFKTKLYFSQMPKHI